MSTIIFLSFVIAFFLIMAEQFFNLLFRGYAPFISTRPGAIDKIVADLELPEKAVVYELGCGKAPLLRALSRKYPQADLIGIENEPVPYLIASIQANLAKTNIKIKRKNLFNINLGDADAVYCYLNPKMMSKLEKKFLSECKNGAVVISYQFPMPELKPEKILEVGEGEKVYFYRINK
ncbi:MAG: class I SAM-dependent methyltransferase [Candidatus Falkowbacteria bacterium]